MKITMPLHSETYSVFKNNLGLQKVKILPNPYNPANPCNSPTPAPVGSQSPEWTLVAFLDSYSFPLSFSPPHLVFFSLLPPLTSFAPQLPSSPPSSCSPALLMEHWATHERRRKPIFSPPRPTSWTPTTLQPPSDSYAEMR